jgi:hypothetical protein
MIPCVGPLESALVVGTGMGFFAVPLIAIGVATLHHRQVHRRLNLGLGWSSQCPICLKDEENRAVPWHVRYSRDVRRRQIKREEFRED